MTPADYCLPTDQRRVTRDRLCDVGAVELSRRSEEL